MRRGFTLIELLIGLALGATLCGIGYSALRLCLQATSAAHRLAIENRVLHAGIEAALDELDSWNHVDDPNDATRQPLRAPGRPFAPLDFTAPEKRLLFDQSQPRRWWRGLGESATDQGWGRYALFSGIAWTGTDPVEQSDRRWYPTLMRDLASGAGYYAMLEYLPANAMLSWFDESGAVPQEFRSWSGLYADGSGRCIGRDQLLHNTGFCVSIDPRWAALNVDHDHFTPWRASPFNRSDLFGDASAVDLRPLPLAPTAWPSLTIRCQRFLLNEPRFVARALITMTSPVSGLTHQITLTPTATTLRGARRARGLDSELP